MFKATVVASKLREKMAEYLDMASGNDVVQILHRGSDIKVLMTQEHYLNLVSKLALYEKPASHEIVSSKSAKDIEQSILAKLKRLDADESQETKRKVGKAGSR
jgi:hypothetical protein